MKSLEAITAESGKLRSGIRVYQKDPNEQEHLQDNFMLSVTKIADYYA